MEFNESLKYSYIFIDMWGYIHYIMIFTYNYKISKYEHVFITIYIVNMDVYALKICWMYMKMTSVVISEYTSFFHLCANFSNLHSKQS